MPRFLRMICAVACVFSLIAPVAAEEEGVVPGIVEPLHDVTVSASIPGTVTKLHYKEGDFVEQGSLVLELEKRQEELEVDRRKLVRDIHFTSLEGTRQLFKTTKSVSQEELNKKEVEFKVADVEYELSREQLRKREIASPLAGYITELFLEAGEDCKAQEPLVRIVDTRKCYFVCDVEAKSAGGLKSGETVQLEVEVGKGRVPVEAKIVFVSPVVDPSSGLLKVKAQFDNSKGTIVPGVAGILHLPKPQS